jgi:hypothetical protein
MSEAWNRIRVLDDLYRIAAHALGVNKNEALVEGNPEVSQLCYAIKEYTG